MSVETTPIDNTPPAEGRFADTSKGFQVEELAKTIVNDFNFVKIEKPDASPETLPADNYLPAVPKFDPPAATENPLTNDTPDYKQTYLDWASSKGIKVNADELGDDFGESQLNDRVADYYIDQRIQDPFLKALAKDGLTVEQYYEKLAPLKEMVALPARDLYLNERITQMINEEVKLGKLADQEAVQTRVGELQEEIVKQIENVPDDVLEQAVAGTRQAYEQQINELPSRIKADQETQWKAQREQAIKQYEQENEFLLGNIKKELDKGNPYGIPFTSQAEKDEFMEYLKFNTAFTNIKVTQNGKETEVQDIPFLHRINTDPEYMVKVLRVMHALDKGGITEIKNRGKAQAVAGLQLEPIVKTGKANEGSGGRFAQTHKGFT